jgi:protein-tyrosine phosphatase
VDSSHIVLSRVIDLHSHVLPGIDDGPRTIEESMAIGRAAQATGTRVMVATPHISWHYPNEHATIARLTGALNTRFQREGIAVEIRPGAEIAMTRADEIKPDELAQLGLGGGRWLLLEPPFTPVVTGIEAVVVKLQNAGHQVLLAHPERCPAFHREPRILESLVQSGVLTSITAGSLVGRFGGEVRRFARGLVERGMVHNVASDAHDAVRRPPGMAAELAEAGFEALADWLALAVPSAILSGEEIPACPSPPASGELRPRRSRWRRR